MPDRLASSAAAVSVGYLGEEAAPAEARPRLRVLLPLPLPAALDYRAPAEMTPPEPGSFVRVPLGGRILVGVVWGGAGGDLAADRLRPIAEILPVPALAPDLRRFVERVAAYTMAPPGAVLRMAMSVPQALHPPRLRRLCVPADAGLAALEPAEPPRPGPATPLTPARRRVLEMLRDGPPLPMADAARLAGCGPGVVRDLVGRGLAEERRVAAETAVAAAPDWRRSGPLLSPDQENAARLLVDRIEAGGFGVTLLDGVTGSGKTETYFAAIAAALGAGRQILVLLPEIALGAQWLRRFRRPLWRGTGAVAFRDRCRPCAATPGAPSPTAGHASSSARARRCSCRSPNSA